MRQFQTKKCSKHMVAEMLLKNSSHPHHPHVKVKFAMKILCSIFRQADACRAAHKTVSNCTSVYSFMLLHHRHSATEGKKAGFVYKCIAIQLTSCVKFNSANLTIFTVIQWRVCARGCVIFGIVKTVWMHIERYVCRSFCLFSINFLLVAQHTSTHMDQPPPRIEGKVKRVDLIDSLSSNQIASFFCVSLKAYGSCVQDCDKTSSLTNIVVLIALATKRIATKLCLLMMQLQVNK